MRRSIGIGLMTFATVCVIGIVQWQTLAPFPKLDARPPPTEQFILGDTKHENKTRRKRWQQERHRVGPGVDWKEIERGNGARQLEKRNGITVLPASTGGWIERGSENQAGRMHVATHSPDGETLYAGSAMGGIWKGSLLGTDWTPIGDNLYGGAHSLAVVPGDDDVLVVLAATDWGSVHITVDDGVTWTEPTGLPSINKVKRVLTSGDGESIVYLLVRESNSSAHYVLFRSTDSMSSFHEIYDLGEGSGDIFVARDGDSYLYMVAAGELMRSEDAGDTWTSLSTLGNSGVEVDLAVSESGGPTLYVVLEDEDLLRSDDGGTSWDEIGTVSDYWGTMTASITDPSRFAWGGVEVHHTTDGGDSFSVVNDWGSYYGDPQNRLHADIPGMDVLLNEKGEEIWYVSTDGGLYKSEDMLDSVENLSLQGLRISQYYGTHTSRANPMNIAAGAQDQGYQLSTEWNGESGLVEFDQVVSGDYAHLISGDGSHDWVFSVYPGFVLVQYDESNPGLTYLDFPAEEEGEYYAWLPPLAADTEETQSFFLCATHLYRYAWNGNSWDIIQWSDQDFQSEPYEYISGALFSKSDPTRGWLTTSHGRIFLSTDRGVNWEMAFSGGPDGHYFHGTAIAQSYNDPDTIYIGGSGYSNEGFFRSTDGGESWHVFGSGLPDTLIYGLVVAEDGSDRVYASTETAAYELDPNTGNWRDLTEATAPVTIYWSVEWVPSEDAARFATYGRGIWDYVPEPYVVPEEPSTTSTTTEEEENEPLPSLFGDEPVDPGCQCGAVASGSSWLAAFLLPPLLLRRRRD
jgi:photosystem II stability/assembly factor-like uncharacterized protein